MRGWLVAADRLRAGRGWVVGVAMACGWLARGPVGAVGVGQPADGGRGLSPSGGQGGARGLRWGRTQQKKEEIKKHTGSSEICVTIGMVGIFFP